MRSIVFIALISLLAGCSARETSAPAGAAAAPTGAPDSGPGDSGIISVPFLVDDHFIPSGCMGDCASSVLNDEDCPDRYGGDAAPDPQGQCHHFLYTADADTGALGWAGVLWQTVEQNWGSQPGREIASGATLMHFYARAAASNPNQSLTFLIGGLNAADGGKACTAPSDCSSAECTNGACTTPHHDTLGVSCMLPITSDWTKIEIRFDGQNWPCVNGTPGSGYGPELMSAFGWTVAMPAGQK
ncbi:MAG TPA: hypothetical protein VGM44_03915, partial [Polyangiaceae bacterium]